LRYIIAPCAKGSAGLVRAKAEKWSSLGKVFESEAPTRVAIGRIGHPAQPDHFGDDLSRRRKARGVEFEHRKEMLETAAEGRRVIVDDEVEIPRDHFVLSGIFIVDDGPLVRKGEAGPLKGFRFDHRRSDDLEGTPRKSPGQTGIPDADMKDPLVRQIEAVEIVLDPELVRGSLHASPVSPLRNIDDSGVTFLAAVERE
jgi:hypothetical protein